MAEVPVAFRGRKDRQGGRGRAMVGSALVWSLVSAIESMKDPRWSGV